MTAGRGRVVSGGYLQIPADFCNELKLADGDEVHLEIIDGELRVRAVRSALEQVRAIVREKVSTETSLADELIAERRMQSQIADDAG